MAERTQVVIYTTMPKIANENLIQLAKARCIQFLNFDSDMTEEERRNIKGMIAGPLKKIDGKVMNLFPGLRVITTVSVAYHQIDVEEATKRGIRVGNTSSSDCVADLGFSLLLGSAKNIVQGDAISKHPETTKFDPNWYGVKVSGSTLGIVGMGRIGSKVAQRANGFDMKILYHNRNKKDPSEEYGGEYCPNLDDLLKQSDFVIITCLSTPETIGMFSARQFSLMKPTSTLINITRGNIVNQDDLVQALQNGTIRAAALDVTDPEPLPRDHPMLNLPNLIITPHIGSATEDTRKAMFKMAIDNLEAGMTGRDLPNGVNKIM